MLSEKEAHLLRHALGLAHSSEAYRNFYAAGEGSPENEIWRGLVDRGLAKTWRQVHYPGPLYCATEAGAIAALRKGEAFDPDIELGFDRARKTADRSSAQGENNDAN